MPETRELRSVIDAAEQAAAAGDYTSAEQLLREAALLQEASLGPLDPDLANTLNNLGVVCEITEKPVDAERYFRRACAIATAVLDPDHPFVATSRKNLEDFCEARGKAVDSPTPPPTVAADRDAPAIGSADLPRERSSYEESRPVASRTWSRPLAIGALIAGGLFITFIGTATWFRSNDEVESSLGSPSVSPAGSPATTAEAPPADTTSTTPPGGQGRESSSLPPATPESRATAAPPAAAESLATAASVPQPPRVAAAHLCKDLSTGGPRGSSSDWQCVTPSLPVGTGSLFFYTRLESPTDTTVQHRWYRGDSLRQVVKLPIRANTAGGYRTYSRHTVNNQGADEWRVELRTLDGVLLHEERFVVR